MDVAERLQVGAISINDASLTGVVNDVKEQLSIIWNGRIADGMTGLTRIA